jgi:hypothetical protein
MRWHFEGDSEFDAILNFSYSYSRDQGTLGNNLGIIREFKYMLSSLQGTYTLYSHDF